ncbi:MAG TPA: glycosyltransferase family 4 protein [Verrucomicrobiae bacterium]|nr:glycosyltransferase family 4 protein [Verrucomicrobiae bacterium]
MEQTGPLKIGLIRQRYVASGGAERYLHGVVEELIARGHALHLFSHAWTDTPGVQFHRIPIVPGMSFTKVLTFALAARKAVRRSHCDVVFSLERTLEQDIYRAGDGCHREWLAQRGTSGAKLNPLHLTILGLEKRVFSPARTGWIIANSRRGKDEIIRHYQFPADRIEVIYNGVDLNRFQPPRTKKKRDEVRLLFVGSGFERKGLLYAICALAKLPPRYKLNVIGSGDIRKFSRLAADMGLGDRVRFAGHDLDMPAEYARADLLVHPAIYEPFANVCLEALASGVPVVTSRINGASEIILHGENGAIVDRPDNVDELVAAIRLFENRDASASARKAAEGFPFAANVQRTLDLLFRVKAAKARRTEG